MAQALERLDPEGHVLVFLPGAAEIRRAQNRCGALAARRGWELLPLHGDQSPEEQDRAVRPSGARKIILSTNVAESSITIEGVRAVIDSGLARVASHSPWSGLPTLQVARGEPGFGAAARRARGTHGAGARHSALSAGRISCGARRRTCRRSCGPIWHPPRCCLETLGAGGFGELEWLDQPPEAAVNHARELLELLGAHGAAGREMARYPVHPRLARLMLEARRRGVAEDGCTVAALLSAGERLPAEVGHATRSDLLALLEARWEPRTEQVVRQLRRLCDPPRQKRRDENALLVSVLAAFPDRVARRRAGAELQMAAGGSAVLAPSSTVTGCRFLVAVEAEDRRDQKAPLVRFASGIEPEWLLDLFPERVRAVAQIEWNRAAERAESVDALLFGEIAIEESRGVADAEAAGVLLAEKGAEAGIARFADVEEVAAYLERVRFAAAHGPVAAPGADAEARALASLAAGLRSFRELEAAARDGGLLRALERQWTAEERRLIGEIAPERLRLPGGRQVKVHYEPGQPPWIASRLQDFFGMRETPAIARGAVPLVVRLLAPNQRPVQMTTDLAGFWERLYPQVRRELARRYPKHKWPERPE